MTDAPSTPPSRNAAPPRRPPTQTPREAVDDAPPPAEETDPFLAARDAMEAHAHLTPDAGIIPRSCVLALGVASITGLAVILASGLGLSTRAAVIFALPMGLLAGLGLAAALIWRTEVRAAEHRAAIIERIRAVAAAEREAPFEALLKIDPRHELAELATTIHDALAAAHRDRLHAARIRREMNALIEREARRQCAHLTALSHTDELTGLANRRGFEKGLRDAVQRANREGVELALLAIDLDHFKTLNDSCGHDKGDEALAIAGDLLQAHTREGDLAGRMGGDELFIALYDTDEARAERVADRVIRLFSAHPAGAGLPCPWPSMSVGISLLHRDRASGDTELRRFADRALYRAKQEGRQRFNHYAPAAAA